MTLMMQEIGWLVHWKQKHSLRKHPLAWEYARFIPPEFCRLSSYICCCDWYKWQANASTFTIHNQFIHCFFLWRPREMPFHACKPNQTCVAKFKRICCARSLWANAFVSPGPVWDFPKPCPSSQCTITSSFRRPGAAALCLWHPNHPNKNMTQEQGHCS